MGLMWATALKEVWSAQRLELDSERELSQRLFPPL